MTSKKSMHAKVDSFFKAVDNATRVDRITPDMCKNMQMGDYRVFWVELTDKEAKQYKKRSNGPLSIST